MLILADGRLLVHNLTPEIAALLSLLNPDDATMRPRHNAGRRVLQKRARTSEPAAYNCAQDAAIS